MKWSRDKYGTVRMKSGRTTYTIDESIGDKSGGGDDFILQKSTGTAEFRYPGYLTFSEAVRLAEDDVKSPSSVQKWKRM